MALMTCGECGHDVSDRADSCPNCGTADFASSGLTCPECEEPVSDDDEVCPGCGFPDPAAVAHSERLQSLGTGSGSSDSSDDDGSAGSGFRRSGKIVMENPENGYRKTFPSPGIKVAFTGSLYFLVHGMWAKAVLGFVVGVFTFGIGWLYIGWKAEDYIKDHYRSKGWRLVSG